MICTVINYYSHVWPMLKRVAISRYSMYLSCYVWLFLEIKGALTSYNKDTVVLKGNENIFFCGSNVTQEVDWNYRHNLSTAEVRIVAGGRLVNEFKYKFKPFRNGLHKLVLQNVTMEDSGTYKCIDNVGIGESATSN